MFGTTSAGLFRNDIDGVLPENHAPNPQFGTDQPSMMTAPLVPLMALALSRHDYMIET